MTDSGIWKICLLGVWGFSARCIQQEVQNYNGEEYSTSTIYRVLHDNSIRLREYRDGSSDEAHTVLRRLERHRKVG